ncbi:MAG: metallophosphoesterase [Vulcanimicrobiaceae bacterium]|jgi:2',3'-cyclic-nucleotide 2'-phosphodiesterase (5'-nucleotidase family)
MRIYHTSDLHNHRGIAPKIRALREREPGLYVDCGDSLRGSQTMFFPREPIIAELDAAGCDVQAMGNREFNYVFGAVRARVSQMHHPLVCSNLIDMKGRALPFARDYTLEVEGWRVRFCALLVPQYPVGSGWERVFGWRFLSPGEVVEAAAKMVASDELFVVMSHLGLRADRALAERVPRIDLLLGGHSHDTLPEPERVGNVPIVHAGPYGTFISRSELTRDPSSGRARLESFALLPLLEQ